MPSPTPEVLAAIADAEAIVIGPSNPVISIGPILAIPGIREAIAAAEAPVVAVSPYVAGRSSRGPPTSSCRRSGALHRRRGRLPLRGPDRRDGLRREGTPIRHPRGSRSSSCPTLMEGPTAARQLAERTSSSPASQFADACKMALG